MTGIPDYTLGDTLDFKFTTRRFSTGAPHQLAGTPVVSAYPDNSTTQITAGITLSVDFDSVTGLNNVRVVATSGNGYAAGSTYFLVITTGTVDSVSVVGEVVGAFSLGRSAAATDLANATDGLGALKTLIDTLDNLVDTEVQAIYDRLGAPAGASTAADIAAIKTVADAIQAVTDLLTAAQSEPTGVPAANATPLTKLGILYMMARNRVDVTSTKKTFYGDDDAGEFEKDLSDDGTTYSESEVNAI